MKFLSLFCFVSLCLALATKPLPPGAEQHTIDPSLNLIPSNDIEHTNFGSVKVVRSYVQEPHGGLEKRVDGIPVPYNVAGPQQIVVAGVTVTFVMAGKWIREGTKNAYRYICKGISFTNTGTRRKVVTLITNGATLMNNQPLPEHRVDGVRAPEGGFGSTVDIVVRNA